MKRISGAFASIFALSILVGVACLALAVPTAPPLDRPILDNADMLTESDEAALNQTINDERLKTGHQIALLTITSLQGDSLEAYSIKVARQWGVGDKDKDNGVLLLIAKDERKLRIEVGSGLEGSLTDARASRIIRNVITPQFKQGDYYNGIRMGIIEIQGAIRGDAESAVSRSSGEDIRWGDVVGTLVFGLYFLLAIVSWIVSILARTKTWWAGGVFGGVIGLILVFIFGFIALSIIAGAALVFMGVVFDYVVSKNYKERKSKGLKPAWWAGGTTLGGGGGSGGGGFGGGGFSGGGASGGW